ncbi:putative Nudix hydrolase NudL [bioreactor metagenome]|uniref:Putative Nudix hydrolase NudL n=1 Tax=bioreactor metagenome TaxID=1076179 RepID=A0A645EZB0_9ZZZZ|nr:CoA pyrophosphatase [Candidatus Metalachnospira sp.]
MPNLINRDFILNTLTSHNPVPEGISRYSAVLIPIFMTEDGPELLFSRRSMTLRHQPGDICFPGGRREGRENGLQTALRETEEEIGIPSENIEVLGRTDFVVTTYAAIITPFVGIVKNMLPSDVIINPDEVEETFTIPLKYFMETEPQEHYVNIYYDIPDDFPFEHIVGGKNYTWKKVRQPELFYYYKDYVIWGFTARIVNNLCYLLKSNL